MAKKMALGRGLGALIEDAETPQQRSEAVSKKEVVGEAVNEIEVNQIQANPFQPRSTFDQEALQELADSIRELGIIQPLTVRLFEGGYQLISGERRLRAAKIAGLKTVPAYIRTTNDQGMLEMALVENIQREDLDAVEVAISYQRLIDECGLTHDGISERVGKKRATVTNYLRLLKLPAEIQLGIRERKISMGHARALVTLDKAGTQLKLFQKILKDELSVRQTEEQVKKLSEIPEHNIETQEAHDIQGVNSGQPNVNGYKDKLQEIFGWGVDVKSSKKGDGKIVISYRTTGELDELMKKFSRFSE